jgi:hypothetical protein
MRMSFGPVIEIEDLGNHRPATVIDLGILLAGCVDVTPDTKRKGFYEVESGGTVYYICVSPRSGTISLLAAWANEIGSVRQLEIARAVPSRTVETQPQR